MGLRIDLDAYRLPLARRWRSARHTIVARRGWLVIASADGIRGFGDCAPLPEQGTESTPLALSRLQYWLTRASRKDTKTLLRELRRDWPSTAPAADCAVESALLDLCSKQQGVTLRHLLAPGLAPRTRIAVNAALGPVGDVTPETLARAVASGFRVLKIKVGVAAVAPELDRIRALCAALPAGVRLRLDANRAWQQATAQTVISSLADLPIESLEEPLISADPRILSRLQRATSISLALDESLVELGRQLKPKRLPVRRLVLKPGVIGGLRPTLDLARSARAGGREAVLTSLVESAAGLWATAQLAAASGSDLAHGLDTASWLAQDLGPPPAPATGDIELPFCPGSGFVPYRG